MFEQFLSNSERVKRQKKWPFTKWILLPGWRTSAPVKTQVFREALREMWRKRYLTHKEKKIELHFAERRYYNGQLCLLGSIYKGMNYSVVLCYWHNTGPHQSNPCIKSANTINFSQAFRERVSRCNFWTAVNILKIIGHKPSPSDSSSSSSFSSASLSEPGGSNSTVSVKHDTS